MRISFDTFQKALPKILTYPEYGETFILLAEAVHNRTKANCWLYQRIAGGSSDFCLSVTKERGMSSVKNIKQIPELSGDFFLYWYYSYDLERCFQIKRRYS